MQINVEPGTYIIAVSGGVDSMALLHALVQQSAGQKAANRYIVAHLNHGIRADADKDRRLVQETARKYGLPFVYDEAKLGAGASEDEARKARYTFLHHVRRTAGACAIITAHHQDDALETALLHMMRGTGVRGLAGLRSTHEILRPLLDTPKEKIRTYAKEQGLVWREDSTNADTRYARNYTRHRLLSRINESEKQQLLDVVNAARTQSDEIERAIQLCLHTQPAVNALNRKWFLRLPYVVAAEIMTAWLRNNGLRDFDKKRIHQVVVGVKTLPFGRVLDVIDGAKVHIHREKLLLEV
jgi:tRNA(Ile)-lysidine synthase